MKSARQQLKELLNGYNRITPKIEKGLRGLGIIVIRKNKHTVVEYFCSNGKIAHSEISGSCSDIRGGLNLASEIANRMGM